MCIRDRHCSVTGFLDADFTHHLTNHNLDVLTVDIYALRLINAYYLRYQIVLGLSLIHILPSPIYIIHSLFTYVRYYNTLFEERKPFFKIFLCIHEYIKECNF